MGIYEDVELLKQQMTEVQTNVSNLQTKVDDSGWIDLQLNTGVEPHSEEQKPRYRKVGNTVFLSGVFKNIEGDNIPIATLPEDYRPSKKVILPFASMGQKINRMEILTNGIIQYSRSTIEPTVVTNWHSIACSFLTD